MVTSNTLRRRIATKTLFVDLHAAGLIDSTCSFNQGDILGLIAGLVKPLPTEADAEFLLGIAPVKVVSGKLPPAYLSDVDASVGTPAIPGPEYGSVYALTLTAGEVLAPGAEVFADPATGPQNVQAAGTKAIGIYQGKAITAPVGGAIVEVLVGARALDDTLKF